MTTIFPMADLCEETILQLTPSSSVAESVALTSEGPRFNPWLGKLFASEPDLSCTNISKLKRSRNSTKLRQW